MLRIDRENRYFLFNYNKSQYVWDNFKGNVKEIILRLPQRYRLSVLWENLLVPIAVRKLEIDIWFSPDFLVPRSLRIPSVITVHDLIYKKFHNNKTNKLSQNLTKKRERSIQYASKIIVTSHFTRTEIEKEYGIPKSKIAVTYLAADERYHRIDESTALTRVLRRYNIHHPYILFVGETSQRKNLIRLLHAYHLLRKDKKLGKRKLIIVGKRTVDTDKILNEVKILQLLSDVYFTGYIPDEDLPFLYNDADIFVFPSLYEGFGIPPLEAMQCQVPVAASHATSIPEVVGDGALMFNPYKVEDIAEKIDQIINNKIDVEDLKKRGKRQAEKFNWEKTAWQTLEVLENLTPGKSTNSKP